MKSALLLAVWLSCASQQDQNTLQEDTLREATAQEGDNMPTSAPDATWEALSSPDEAERVRAARALHEAGDPRAVEACLRTLDDAPDMLHTDRTPAVRCLVEIGEPALEPLLQVLSSPAVTTRLRAQRAVEGITKRLFGFDGRAWPEGALDNWLQWWQEIGYEHDSSETERAAGLQRLSTWIESRQP